MFKVHNQCDDTYWPFDFENISRRGFYMHSEARRYVWGLWDSSPPSFCRYFYPIVIREADHAYEKWACPNQVLKATGGPVDHKATTTYQHKNTCCHSNNHHWNLNIFVEISLLKLLFIIQSIYYLITGWFCYSF